MSFAPRDTHEAQVWFALERGVPAMIGVIGSQRLPYPARAFDMAHCSRCLIPWSHFGKTSILISSSNESQTNLFTFPTSVLDFFSDVYVSI